jgi:uncharacterized membrane protein YraQ (UPF0718 family)
MTTLVSSLGATLGSLRSVKIDRAWLAVLAVLGLLAALDAGQFLPSLRFAADALISTAPYVVFAILAVAYLKASGAEAVVGRAFEGRETRMIVLAALLGGLAPFCSCQVIPFIAGLLALGTPLSAVMAFWLSSPLIDPATLLITAGALGWPFAIGKTAAAVGIGLLGGFAVQAATAAGRFANPLRPRSAGGCSSCGTSPFKGRPVWAFWHEDARRAAFRTEGLANAHFLLKWLTLAYLLESLMVTYVPAEAIAGLVGGPGLGPILLSAVVGAPAYLNSFAAPPVVAGLMLQGMSAGAAMAFMVAGAVSSIPAMTAVFALVNRQVFAAYVALGFLGATLSGLAYGAVAALAIF